MLDQLTSIQLSEWQAYDRLEPMGEDRADFRMAYLSTIITNIARKLYGKAGVEMTVPLDFMPEWDREEEDIEEGKIHMPKKQTVEQMKHILEAIAGVQNKKIKKKKEREYRLNKNSPKKKGSKKK